MEFKNPNSFIFFFFSFSFFFILTSAETTSPETFSGGGGTWTLLQRSIGVSAMHMQVLRNNKVVIFDGLEVGPSNLSLPNNNCLRVTRHAAVPVRRRRRIGSSNATKVVTAMKIVSVPVTDCTAHSVLYDLASNSYRALTLKTNTWCSSGAVLPDGTLVQTGGFGEDGIHKIRTFSCSDPGRVFEDEGCDWSELASPELSQQRWYSSNQILPDGRVIIVGGRQSFSYEFFPKTRVRVRVRARNYRSGGFDHHYMQFLSETADPVVENNLYPFLHLLPDGNLFVFANNQSVVLDYQRNVILRRLPVIPGGFHRSYPSTGSSVLLPLRILGDGEIPAAEIMVCGGAPAGAFRMSERARVFLPAARTCGRIRIFSDSRIQNPNWEMEEMPFPRVMPDMILLPTGDLVILNGASRGTAGWNDAISPVLTPILYRDGRFRVLTPTEIPRLYHSSAVLVPSGAILVGGSNPHRRYNFSGKPYPTELSLELYKPYYLGTEFAEMKPAILTIEAGAAGGMTLGYGEGFAVTMVLRDFRGGGGNGVEVVLVAPSFTTHSFAMNQRVVVLEAVGFQRLSDVAFKASARGPPSRAVAPPGFYMLFLVHSGVPSEAVWVRLV